MKLKSNTRKYGLPMGFKDRLSGAVMFFIFSIAVWFSPIETYKTAKKVLNNEYE